MQCINKPIEYRHRKSVGTSVVVGAKSTASGIIEEQTFKKDY